MTVRTPRALLLLALAACSGTGAAARDTATTSATSAVPPTGSAPPITFAELAALPASDAEHRIAYGAEAEQVGELRLPSQGDGSLPVVVLIHGGCWLQAYDVAHTRPLAAALAGAGYAVWSPEYRRVGGAGGYPATFEDVAAAVDGVRELARRFPRIDTTRVVLAGHSAGGHLALWAAARRIDDHGIGGLAPLRPAGVVSLAGIADLATYAAGTGSCNASVVPLLGGTPAEQPARYAATSPVSTPPLVPVRIVHGAADPIVPLAQSEALVRAMERAGRAASLATIPAAGHFDVVAPRGPSFDALLAAIEALVGR